MDKDLKALRNARWDKAFAESRPDDDNSGVTTTHDGTLATNTNRKATIVIEHLIQASDVAHTMQHWHIYRRWNQRLFEEMFVAYQEGRSDTDPCVNWYKGEMGFLIFTSSHWHRNSKIAVCLACQVMSTCVTRKRIKGNGKAVDKNWWRRHNASTRTDRTERPPVITGGGASDIKPGGRNGGAGEAPDVRDLTRPTGGRYGSGGRCPKARKMKKLGKCRSVEAQVALERCTMVAGFEVKIKKNRGQPKIKISAVQSEGGGARAKTNYLLFSLSVSLDR